MTSLSAARQLVTRHLPQLLKFGMVGLSGLAVNTAVLLLLAEGTPLHYLAAVVGATQASTIWNFVLTERFVFTDATSEGRWARFAGFALLNNGALLVRGPLILYLTEGLGQHYAVANFVTLSLVMVARYAASVGILWRPRPAVDSAEIDGSGSSLLVRFRQLRDRIQTRASSPGEVVEPEPSQPRQVWWRKPVVSVAIVGAVGLILRFWSIGELGLNSDEAVYTGQGASLAGLEPFTHHFSVFRAHPLLFQYTVAAIYRLHFWDTAGRWVAAGFGLATLWITFRLAEQLVSRRAAWLATGFLAVMPYHVVVSRQALLESPMTFFMTLTMYALYRYRQNPTVVAALGIGAAAGLAFLAKETAIIVLLSVGIFVALRGGWHTGKIFAGMLTFALMISPHLYATVAGRASEGEGGSGWANYLLWQLSRPPNHPDSFYFSNLAHYFGIPMLLLIAAGLIWLVRREGRSTDRSVLLLAWAGVPALIFQLYPVKGYHYLLPIAPAVAIMAAIGIGAVTSWLQTRAGSQPWTTRSVEWFVRLTFAVAIVVAAINGPIFLNHARIGEAGYSGLPNVRELTDWINEEAPEGSRFLGIGPSITNVIAFYSDRETLALSVSPNPLRRNPAYSVVRNADYDVRWGLYEYLIYDAYSAARTSHFANRVLDLADRYSTEIVYEDEGQLVADDGETFTGPIFRIYRVAPIGSTEIESDGE